MSIIENVALQELKAGRLSLGFGVSHLRTVATAQLARSAGYHWLAIDMEHGALSLSETSQMSLAALAVGIAPIVRVGWNGFDEGTRALDSGAQGVIVPQVNNAAQARSIVDAFLYGPLGRRNWSGNGIQFAYKPPPVAEAREAMNRETLIVAMIETEEGVANAPEIAATQGIDILLFGMVDLSLDMGIPQQFGHQRVQDAVTKVAAACGQNQKFLGIGGVYDDVWAKRYIEMGARFIAGGNDQGFLLSAARERSAFLSKLLPT